MNQETKRWLKAIRDCCQAVSYEAADLVDGDCTFASVETLMNTLNHYLSELNAAVNAEKKAKGRRR